MNRNQHSDTQSSFWNACTRARSNRATPLVPADQHRGPWVPQTAHITSLSRTPQIVSCEIKSAINTASAVVLGAENTNKNTRLSLAAAAKDSTRLTHKTSPAWTAATYAEIDEESVVYKRGAAGADPGI